MEVAVLPPFLEPFSGPKARADGVAFPPFLQEQGMSGGQQNKDEEVVKMVARMNELKEKQACHSCDSRVWG